MPKVVHILPALPVGGAERMLVDLVNGFVSSEWRHEIIIFYPQFELAGELHDPSVVYLVPKKGRVSLGLISGLRKKLQELRPDIVHTHLFGGDCWGRLAARGLNLPIVSTEHNINRDEGWHRELVRFLFSDFSDHYAAVSESVEKYLLGLGVKKPITVINNGIVLKRFLPIGEPKFVGSARMLILGRLVEQKGHVVAIDALAKLKQYPWFLTIMGDGKKEAFLKKEVQALGLSDRVNFLPASVKVEEVLPEYDMVLMPSLWEGLGIVAMEAMASGRALVASNCDGLKELVWDGETGIAANAGDVDDWVKKLRWCWENLDELSKIAREAREYARKNFGIEKMVSEYKKIYEKVIRSHADR